MTPLSPDTVLFRAPRVRLTLDGAIRIDVDGGELVTNERGLDILGVFAHPLRLADALTRLEAKGPQDWIDLSTSILHMYEAGILRDAADADVCQDSGGFAAAQIHIEMLDDEVRTSSFLAAIREVVRPGDVVLEIGTGTGVLAIGAARAGARRVYAVERTAIRESAKALFLANDVGDRVTLLTGHSSRVDLPERANVLVSEVIGNDIFDERIVDIVRDARRRFLLPDARLIPSRLRVFALPLDIPGEELARHSFALANLERWRSLYGIDFSPLSKGSYGHPALFRTVRELRGWRRMGDPVLLTEVDLARVEQTDIEAEATCVFREAGTVSGVLVYFEADLSPNVTLSMHPDRAGAESHWTSKVTMLAEGIRGKAGDRLKIRYSFRGESRVDVG
jgi:hypothetical protein